MWLLLAFIAVPLVEIALFIQVGGLIGLWPTLGIVVVTAIAGTLLVRSQGARAMLNLRRSLSTLSDPSEDLAHGAMILFSGALLLTPGFFTDALGFALLIPGVRKAVFRMLKARINIQTFSMGPDPRQSADPYRRRPDDRVVDGDFEDVTPGKAPTHRPSGWTEH